MTIKPVRRSEIKPPANASAPARPSREEARAALKTILRHIGEDPEREGLRDTPDRVLRAWGEYFAGYDQDARAELGRTFEDIAGYDDMVLVRDIDFVSHCEHHMVPILGRAHVAYWPAAQVVGISKLARVVDIHARRLISQENMTRQIADTIDRVLAPRGVAVLVRAAHFCMSTRGVAKPSSSTVTSTFTGIFKDDPDIRARFMAMAEQGGSRYTPFS